MARGVRKTSLEKLQQELEDVQNSMKQYQNALETLKEKEANLRQQLEIEEFKSVRELMNVNNMSLDELKELIVSAGTVQQTA